MVTIGLSGGGTGDRGTVTRTASVTFGLDSHLLLTTSHESDRDTGSDDRWEVWWWSRVGEGCPHGT